jgi:hypothetical protein
MRDKNYNPCKQCKIRKSKCDGAIPQCSACEKARKKLGVCCYQKESLEVLPVEDDGNLLFSIQDLHTLGKQIYASDTLQSWTSSTGSINYASNLTLNCPLKLESFLESHLLCLSSAFFLNKDSCLNILFPTKRAHPVSEELKNTLCCFGIFLSSHPEIFGFESSFQARLKISHQYYGIDPLLLIVASDSFFSMYHVYDSIKALIIRAFIAVDTLNHVQTFNEMVKSAFSLIRKFDILNSQYFIMSKHYRWSQIDLDERVERLTLIALIFDLDTSLAVDSNFQFHGWEIPLVNLPKTLTQYYQLSPEDMQCSIWSRSLFHQVFVDNAVEVPSLDSVSLYEERIMEAKLYRNAITFFHKNAMTCNEDFYLEQCALHEQILQIAVDLPFANLTLFVHEQNPVFSKITKPSIHKIILVLAMLSSIHTPAITTSPKFALVYGQAKLYTSRQILFVTVKCLSSLLTTLQPPNIIISPLLADISFSLPKILTICRNSINCFKTDTTCREFALVWYMVSQDIQSTLRLVASVWPGMTSASQSISEILSNL